MKNNSIKRSSYKVKTNMKIDETMVYKTVNVEISIFITDFT